MGVDISGEYSPTAPWPEIEITEGNDFTNIDEIVYVLSEIMGTLTDIDTDELVASGYNYDAPETLTTFYGMTLAEYKEWVSRGETWTPLHFGVLSIVDGKGNKDGRIAIGIYDPRLLVRVPDSCEFSHYQGRCIDEAKIAVFLVSLPFLHPTP